MRLYQRDSDTKVLHEFYQLEKIMVYKRELKVYLIVFLVPAFGMHHKEFISYPIEHITNLPNAAAYGFGVIHPIVFSFFIYLFVWLPRLMVRAFSKQKSY